MDIRDERWWWLDREHGIAQIEARKQPQNPDRPTSSEMKQDEAFNQWIAAGRPENDEEED